MSRPSARDDASHVIPSAYEDAGDDQRVDSAAQDLQTVRSLHGLTALTWAGPRRGAAPRRAGEPGREPEPGRGEAPWRPASRRQFAHRLPDLRIVADLVRMAYGECHGRRAVASAGALYSLSIHAVPLGGGRLYSTRRDGTLLADDLAPIAGERLAASIFFQVTGACWLLIIGAAPEPCVRRYGPRAYRYLLVESGLVIQECIRAATAHRVDTCILGAFDDHAVTDMVGGRLNGHLPLMLLAAGYAPEAPEAPGPATPDGECDGHAG